MAEERADENLQRAREQLHVSEERFRLMVEGIEDYAIFMLDPRGHVLTWNAGAQRIKGYTAAEIVGQHFSKFYRREDVDAGEYARLLAEATRAGRVEAEGWRVRKDGSMFWGNVVITAVRSTDGALLGFVKITRDLTERRKAEEDRIRIAQMQESARAKDEMLAREQEARRVAEEAHEAAEEARRAAEEARRELATTLQSIGEAVIATDERGGVRLMNPVAERLTGLALSEARGRPLHEVFHILDEGTRGEVESPIERVRREDPAGLSGPTLLLARDGVERSIRYSAAPIRDRSGAVLGSVIVFRDISAENRASRRRELLAEVTTALSASLDYRDTLARVAALLVPALADWCSIDIVDENDRPVQAGAAHVDASKAELLRELRRKAPFRPDRVPGNACVFHAGRSEGATGAPDWLIDQSADDDRALALAREARSAIVAPLVAGTRILGTISLVHGESGRQYTEDDVAAVEELGRRATTAMENARLYAAEQRARDMADAASRAKDEFLALVSHELRTPLSAILGWAQILSRSTADERKRARAVETIERNAVAMTQLIDDLLDVSRIVNGKVRLEVHRVDLPRVVEAAVDAVRPAADTKSIRIELMLGVSPVSINGDPARLQQVVWNLVNNAVKFTPSGGRVTVALRQLDASVEITVSDTGKGIAPRFLPHVFEPFRQADAGMTRATGGLGLGLAIVKHLAELHGGQVEAHSEGEGRGSTFTVRLPMPVVRPATDSRPLPAQPRDASFESLPQLAGLHVLAVEDEPDMREMLRDVLADCGCFVTTAGSVAEAMSLFEGGTTPDVLLSDISMPGETGYDLIRRVRALPPDRGGHVPAAALTAYTRAEDRQKVLRAGFELHVPKPVEAAELVSAIATLARFANR